jgi:hypothetical protein
MTHFLWQFSNSDNLQRGVCELVRTIPRTGLLHPLGNYQKNGNDAVEAWWKSWPQEILDISLCWHVDDHGLVRHGGQLNGGVASLGDSSKQCCLLQHPHTSSLSSLTTTTCRVVSASQFILFQRLVCCISQEVTRKMTSVGSMWSVLKHDCVAVIISQPVFQVSPNNFWMILISLGGIPYWWGTGL